MSEWQPIDSYPNDRRSTLLYFKAGSGTILIGYFDDDDGCWYEDDYALDGRPTHWMPLPEPPQE